VPLIGCPRYVSSRDAVSHLGQGISCRPVDPLALVARHEELYPTGASTLGVHAHAVPVDFRKYLNAGAHTQKSRSFVRKSAVIELDASGQTVSERLLEAKHTMLRAFGREELIDTVLRLKTR
jgi:hypothetical protein